jgi:AraC-like DNA-binding protein
LAGPYPPQSSRYHEENDREGQGSDGPAVILSVVHHPAMPLPPVFDSWDCKRPALPPRSRLYPLEPIGVGTPFVESLTGYVARLAEVHATSVSSLVGFVLAEYSPPGGPIISWRTKKTRVGTGFKPGTHAINGIAEDARRWIFATEAATCRSDLRFLTLSPLRQIFCKQRLLRVVQAWCPHCLEEWRQRGQPVYLPLAWNLQHVTACAWHWTDLVEICPYCHGCFGPLFAKARPGHCPRCSQWLGVSLRTGASPVATTTSMERSWWTASTWGDLLSIMPRAEAEPLCETFRQNFFRLVTQLAEGKTQRFSAIMRRYSAQNAYSGDAQVQTETCAKLSWRAAGSWISGECMPRPDWLLELCYRFHVKPSDLLLRRRIEWVIDENLRKEADLANRGCWRHPPEQMRNVLRAALTENPPPTLCEVARRLGYRTHAPLQRLDPECCDRIVRNYRRCRKQFGNKWTVQDRPGEKEKAAEILKDSLAQDRPTPIAQIARQLGYQSSSRLKLHFPELCSAIAAKERQNRETQREAIRQGLITAATEEPPPTIGELMRRLHCYENAVRDLFPNLFTKVLEARKAWRIRQLEQTRAKVTRLADEMAGSSVPCICKAAGVGIAFFMHRFPDLYQRIIYNYIEQRDATRRLRRERLCEEVVKIVVELSRTNITPTTARVAELLSDQAAHDWKLIQHAVADARRKSESNSFQTIQNHFEYRLSDQPA